MTDTDKTRINEMTFLELLDAYAASITGMKSESGIIQFDANARRAVEEYVAGLLAERDEIADCAAKAEAENETQLERLKAGCDRLREAAKAAVDAVSALRFPHTLNQLREAINRR